MNRRSFLKRLGVSVAAVALASSIVQGLAALFRKSPSSDYDGWNIGTLESLTSTLPEWNTGPGTFYGIHPNVIEDMKLRAVLDSTVPEYALMPMYNAQGTA